MSVPFSAATAAYNSASRLIDNRLKPAVAGEPTGAQGPDFAKLLSGALESVEQTGKASDQKSLDLLNGKGNLVDVVTSVAQTQLAVEGLVAVRDRVISAYQSIMQMPI
jgi:flagellar hook-basal body complex protein FliE